MKKKLSTILLALIVIICIGCSANKEQSEILSNTPSETTAEPEVTGVTRSGSPNLEVRDMPEATVPVKKSDEPETENWEKLYSDHVKEIISTNGLSAEDVSTVLVYINDDDIPEQVLSMNFGAGFGTVCTVTNGELKTVYTSPYGIYYIERDNVFLNYEGEAGFAFDLVYTINDGMFELIGDGERGGGEYYWNGVTVDESAYVTTLNSLIDVNRATSSETGDICADELGFTIIDPSNGGMSADGYELVPGMVVYKEGSVMNWFKGTVSRINDDGTANVEWSSYLIWMLFDYEGQPIYSEDNLILGKTYHYYNDRGTEVSLYEIKYATSISSLYTEIP